MMHGAGRDVTPCRRPGAVFICAALIVASSATGCAGGSAYATGGNSAGQSSCVAGIAPAGVETIGLNLANPAQATCTDPTYQLVHGFFGGGVVTTSQVVSVTHSSADLLQFKNLDIQPHTAASVGAWSGSYPPSGPSAAATPSPAMLDISSPGFTTGNLNGGATSASYVANVPGIYVFGCAYHYASDQMRTVIIVM